MSGYPGRIVTIPDPIREQMQGLSWRDEARCPPFDELALLELPFWDFGGAERWGELVVARSVADAVRWAFSRIHAARFPIARMARVDVYGADDRRSMEANNTSGFNFRLVEGTARLSKHALGLAVDINPVQNPWVRGGLVLPPAGSAYLVRDPEVPGLISRPGPVVDAFTDIGWGWGGEWAGYRDYHHFQA